MGLRETLQNKPWIGYAIAGVLLVVSVVLAVRSFKDSDPYSPSNTTEIVTIRYTDTNEEVSMPRGRFEKMLAETVGRIDPSKGIINPKTNQPTGFLVSKSEWEETVKRMNAEKEAAAAARGKTLPPLPSSAPSSPSNASSAPPAPKPE
ncbi:MAG: hypothetical protein IPK69_03280 [Phycisphaerales bacterium]|nr:MAG: hypothetical protein IPK69_03280 [Phycisphaerales bacterium]